MGSGPKLRPPRSKRNRNGVKGLGHSRDDRGWTMLHIASHRGDFAKVDLLLKSGIDVDEPSFGPKYPGATALHLAAGAGHVAVMDLLLENGANIEARTRGSFGWTPLHHAAKSNQQAAMLFLVDSGAFVSPDLCDPRFNPPLHYCRGLPFARQAAGLAGEELPERLPHSSSSSSCSSLGQSGRAPGQGEAATAETDGAASGSHSE